MKFRFNMDDLFVTISNMFVFGSLIYLIGWMGFPWWMLLLGTFFLSRSSPTGDEACDVCECECEEKDEVECEEEYKKAP